jgi:hypothetical protein
MSRQSPGNRTASGLWLVGWVGMMLCLTWSLALGMRGEARYDQLISTAAHRHGMEPALVKAVIKCESRFNPWAVSPRGAQGLMQLMPATQSLLGVPNAFDPRHNIAAGVRYLAMLRQTFGTDAVLLLAAYNAGPQAVIAAGNAVPPYAETQRYVQCVLAAREHYRHQGINEWIPRPAQTQVQADESPTIVVGPLRLSDTVARVGQRLTIHLNVRHTQSEVTHGTILLIYPEPLVSFIALHTSGSETTVRLPSAQSGHMAKASWVTTEYQFLQGSWPVWQPGQQRTAVLALVPRLPQDLALHLSVLLYDSAGSTVQHRWSTVVRIPVRASSW